LRGLQALDILIISNHLYTSKFINPVKSCQVETVEGRIHFVIFK